MFDSIFKEKLKLYSLIVNYLACIKVLQIIVSCILFVVYHKIYLLIQKIIGIDQHYFVQKRTINK